MTISPKPGYELRAFGAALQRSVELESAQLARLRKAAAKRHEAAEADYQDWRAARAAGKDGTDG